MTQLSESTLRLFVAFELPEATLEALRQLQAILRQRHVSGLRWVRPEGIHLTLKFLGNVPSAQVTAIVEAITAAVGQQPGLTLRLGKLGTFGDRRGPRVIWVDVGGEVAHLKAVHSAVEKALVSLGFPAENRPFSPHLTLARVADLIGTAERQRLAEVIAAISVPPTEAMTFTEISLMQSILGPGGAVYRRLAVVPLSAVTHKESEP